MFSSINTLEINYYKNVLTESFQNACKKPDFRRAFKVATSFDFLAAICLSGCLVLKTVDKAYEIFEQDSTIPIKMTRGRRKMGRPGPWNPARATLPWVRGHEWEDFYELDKDGIIKTWFSDTKENFKNATRLFQTDAVAYCHEKDVITVYFAELYKNRTQKLDCAA
jgi:hypothetical protein